MSKAFQFGKAVKELRFHLCQKSPASQGVRQFLEKNYLELKKLNQATPILVREAHDVQPKIWARYELGKEAHLPLTNMSESQVLSALEKLAKK